MLKRNPNFFLQKAPIIKPFSEKFGFYISLDFGENEQHQELSGGDRADGAGVQPLSSEEQQNKEAEEPDNGEDSLSGSFLDNPDFAEKAMEVQKGILCSDSFLIHKTWILGNVTR